MKNCSLYYVIWTNWNFACKHFRYKISDWSFFPCKWSIVGAFCLEMCIYHCSAAETLELFVPELRAEKLTRFAPGHRAGMLGNSAHNVVNEKEDWEVPDNTFEDMNMWLKYTFN